MYSFINQSFPHTHTHIRSVCKSMKSWLDSDPLHVAVVHCKGGKGRTGCVIAAFMHYSEICHRWATKGVLLKWMDTLYLEQSFEHLKSPPYAPHFYSAEAALDRFAMKRFYDSKCGGVTQPSQRKYVHYFADLLAGKIDLQSPWVCGIYPSMLRTLSIFLQKCFDQDN